MSLKRSLVRKRSGGEKEIYRGLCGLRAALLGTLFYANRLSFFLVSRCALSPRRRKRSQLLRHALPSLPYLRCNLFPGINAPGIFPAATDLARARDISCAPAADKRSLRSKAWSIFDICPAREQFLCIRMKLVY